MLETISVSPANGLVVYSNGERKIVTLKVIVPFKKTVVDRKKLCEAVSIFFPVFLANL